MALPARRGGRLRKEADVPPAARSMLQHWLGKKYRPGVRDGSDAMTRHIVLF